MPRAPRDQPGPSTTTPNGDGPKTGDKRRWTPAMYERRRAASACQTCRMRKTKCDNQRPICGFCQQSRGRCVYTDKAATDHSSFDPASIAILERVNHAVSLLESGLYTSALAQHATFAPSPASVSAVYTSTSPQERVHPQYDNVTQRSPPASGKPSTSPEVPSSMMNAESVLRWPIFDGSAPDVESFVLDCDNIPGSTSTRAGPPSGRGVCEEDFHQLSQKFLAYVHVKNPILDIDEYKTYVRRAAEYGPGWDGPSCIVLITCALASLATSLEPDDPTIDQNRSPSYRAVTNRSIDKDAASAYFMAAQKRLGFLRPSLLYVQCLFLFGVFQMYSMDVMQAWFYFNQACIQFRSILWMRAKGATSSPEPVDRSTKRLEQRLYWSCLKSELEFQCEIPLPSSGLSTFDYPDLLPSPPGQVVSPTGTTVDTNIFSGGIELDEERSWFYYLAEISSRRMLSHAITIMGANGEQGWLQDISAHVHNAKTLLEQLDLWFSHLPDSVNVQNPQAANNELAQLIWGRGMAYREWLHRPFIYYVIHQTDAPGEVMALAKAGLQISVDMILSRFPRHKHRHHGTWYLCRYSASRALILLAAAKSSRVELPSQWRDAVDMAVAVLEAWSDEARDIKKAGEVVAAIAVQIAGRES